MIKITLGVGQHRPQAMVVVGSYLFLALRTVPAQLVRLNASDLGGAKTITFPVENFPPTGENKFQSISDIAVVGTKLYCLHQGSSQGVVTEVDAATMAWRTVIATEEVNDTLAITTNGVKLFTSGYGQADTIGKGEISQFSVVGGARERVVLIPNVVSQRPACRLFGEGIYTVNGDNTTKTFSVMRFPDEKRVVSGVPFIQPWANLERLGDWIYVSTFGPSLSSSSAALHRFHKDTFQFEKLSTWKTEAIRQLWSDGQFLYFTTRGGAFTVSRYDGTTFKHVQVTERLEFCVGDKQGNLFAGSWTDPKQGETSVPPAEIYKYSLAALFGDSPTPVPKTCYFVAGDSISVTLSDGARKWRINATPI